MVHEFKLPDVGEGVAEGELVTWLVEPGDAVTEDQPVAEVETDKALVEVPSPVDGTVRELLAEEGEVMQVGEVFITFDVAGEDAEPAARQTESGPVGGEAPEPDAGVAEETAGSATGPDTGDATPAGGGEAAAEEDEGTAAAEPAGADRVFAAPSVRRLARELDVDLTAVAGSGPGGRIEESDVRAAVEDGRTPTTPEPDDGQAAGGAPQEPSGAAGGAGGVPARERTLAAPATRQLAKELGVDLDAVPASEERDGEAFVTSEDVEAFAEAGGEPAAGAAAGDAAGVAPPAGEDERVPYQGVRRTIGQQMETSAFSIPHVSHHELLDAKALVEAREALKPPAQEQGIQLTYLPFVMRAAAAALKEFPYVNARLDEEAEDIVLRGEYNLGFAVATDDGLFVPVVDHVDRKGLLQLASEINELAEKARDRSISLEEMQGGTFTITNYGSVGGDYGTPLINHPEVAILGLGAIKRRPFVVDAEVEARHTLPLSLSIDHRIIDGAKAARFVGEFARYVEEPTLLLLD